MTNQPGIKCWLSLTQRTITTVEPSTSTANRFVEGRFLTKDDLIALSFQVTAEIYAAQLKAENIPGPITSIDQFLARKPLITEA